MCVTFIDNPQYISEHYYSAGGRCCGYFHNNSMTMLINECICMQIKCMISIHVCDILSHKQVSHKQVSHKQVSHKQVSHKQVIISK